jgi:glutathione S-transferase
MANLRLFGSRISPFVEKVARALALKEAGFELVDPRRPTEFRQWNPQTGKMPVLELDGERIYDSTLILRELDRRFPNPPLVSSDPKLAAAQRQVEDWADEALYWYFMAVRWTDANAAATTAQITAGLSPLFRPIARLILPRQLRGMARAQGLGRLPVPMLMEEIEGRLDDLVTIIGDDPFIFGDAPSVADLAVYGQLQMAESGPTPELAALIRARPSLVELQRRVEERASA